MAVKATFSADFSSFQEAVKAANVSLDKFQSTTANAEKALNRMVDNFSGRKVITDATLMAEAVERLGGTSKFTTTELARMGQTAQEAIAKLRAVGTEIPPQIEKLATQTQFATSRLSSMSGALSGLNGLLGAFGVGLSLSSIVSFGKAILDDADALTKMSDKTGIGTEALQRLRAIAEPSGNTLEELSGAINKFQKNLVEGNEPAIQSLNKLGISVEQIRNLSPDQQFITIAKAIAQVPDPAERAARAMEIFGRGGAEILPSLVANVDELKNSTVVMSKEATKAWDDLGDAVQRYWRNVKATVGNAIVTPPPIPTAQEGQQRLPLFSNPRSPEALETLRRQVQAQLAQMLAQGTGVSTFDAKSAYTDEFATSLDQVVKLSNAFNKELTPAEKAAMDAAIAHAKALEHLREQYSGEGLLKQAQDYETTIKAIGGAEKLTADEKHKLADEFQKVIDKYKAFGPAGAAVVQHFTDLKQRVEPVLQSINKSYLIGIDGISDLSKRTQEFSNELLGLTKDGLIPEAAGFDDVSRAERATKLYTDELARSDAALQAQLAKTIGLMPDLSSVAKEHFRKMAGESRSFTSAFASTFDDLPEIIQRSFEGGGGIEGALRAGLTNIAKNLFGKGGVWEQEVSNNMKASAVAVQAGLAVAAGLSSPGSRGANIIGGAQIGAGIGSNPWLLATTGGWSLPIGAGAGALAGAFKKPDDEKAAEAQFNAFKRQVNQLFDATTLGTVRAQVGTNEWAKMVEAVKKAYLDTGRSATDAMKDLDTAVRHTRDDVEKLPDDLAKINDVLTEQQKDAEDTRAALEKYGFTVADLKPEKQFEEIAKQGLALERTFTLLAGAVRDPQEVIRRMADDINDFIHTALKTGTEVPEEMRPMLEQMVAMGKLTDENGNAITDLGSSGLKFSETMTQGFDRVVTALEKVLKALGWVDDAIDNLPDKKEIAIGFTDDKGVFRSDVLDAQAATRGGRVTANGIQYFATGGNVLRFAKRGTDTVPAMLTPGERVLSVEQNRAYESGLRVGIQPVARTAITPVTLIMHPTILKGDLDDPPKLFALLNEELRADQYGFATNVEQRVKRMAS